MSVLNTYVSPLLSFNEVCGKGTVLDPENPGELFVSLFVMANYTLT